jgi:hypothetical protein
MTSFNQTLRQTPNVSLKERKKERDREREEEEDERMKLIDYLPLLPPYLERRSHRPYKFDVSSSPSRLPTSRPTAQRGHIMIQMGITLIITKIISKFLFIWIIVLNYTPLSRHHPFGILTGNLSLCLGDSAAYFRFHGSKCTNWSCPITKHSFDRGFCGPKSIIQNSSVVCITLKISSS